MYAITDWMQSWGWTKGPDERWLKLSPSGLVVATQDDSTWTADCARAAGYESQLIGTMVQ